MVKPANQARKVGKVAKLEDHPAFGKGKIMEGGKDRLVGRDECLKALSRYGSISPELAEMLEIPAKLYRHGKPEEESFSSDPERPIDELANALLYSSVEEPLDLPDFGITISSRGDNVFAVLADKGRGIIVYESVDNLQGGPGSWNFFEAALRRALELTSTLKLKNQKFSYVIEGDIRQVLD